MAYSVGKHIITPILTDELWKECCYLVSCTITGEQALIDPGNNAAVISNTIESNGNKKLKYILITHGHHDHVGEIENIAKKFGVKGLIHKNDALLAKHSPIYAIRFDNRIIKTPREVEMMNKEQYEFGKDDFLKIIFTPGHTKGSVCFSFSGFVFTGDTLLNEFVGRTDLPDSKPEEIVSSVDKLLFLLKDDDMIFPGHGNPWEARDAKKWWVEHRSNPPQHRNFN